MKKDYKCKVEDIRIKGVTLTEKYLEYVQEETRQELTEKGKAKCLDQVYIIKDSDDIIHGLIEAILLDAKKVILEHNEQIAIVEYSKKDNCFYGRLVDSDEGYLFTGNTFDDAYKNFMYGQKED